MTEFEKCLRYGRMEKKVSQRDLAQLAGMEPGDISRLESGLFVPLEATGLSRIAKAIGYEANVFIAMCRSAFRQELNEQREASDVTSAEKPRADMSVKAPALVKDTFLLVELEYINRAIMNLPDKTRDAVVPLIKMLVSSYGANASA